MILSLPVDCRVNELGGYGPSGEVIYTGHPRGCPSAIVDSREGATVSLMSNGSVEFTVANQNGATVPVLAKSFDPVEKREISVPSQNVWISLPEKKEALASIVNPSISCGLKTRWIKIVKIGEPFRQMWHCAEFSARGCRIQTALKLALVVTESGPALFRGIYVLNSGTRPVNADLWTFFSLHGTQRFVYNKAIWYDSGLPLTPRETVVCARIPYTDDLQLKRISTFTQNADCVESTCDYSCFAGDTSASALFPFAVRNGRLGPGAAGRLNRFATPAVAASHLKVDLEAGAYAVAGQSLLYVTDPDVLDSFARASVAEEPSYKAIASKFKSASTGLVNSTPGARDSARRLLIQTGGGSPSFSFEAEGNRMISEYAGSVWTGVEELYENCRAHGATLAEGIELGTRDRGQDMWPKMKADPGRVRKDLVHAFSFMYVTCEEPVARKRKLTLKEKLHGMFPRQYPSRWNDRSAEIPNDNRPYADSPLWLVNSLVMYIRETGDVSILQETVPTVRLINPDDPENSSMTGNSLELTVIEVVMEIFRCFGRHVKDSPYGLAQVMYGDWCDPIDMFGTSAVGDAATRGRGRGVHLRLTGHLFECLVQTLDLFQSADVRNAAAGCSVRDAAGELVPLANLIRHNAVKWAWEDTGQGCSGFVSVIHELKADGSVPDYKSGERGYTLGSMQGDDFDGVNRRDLAAQAYCMQMLQTERKYLEPVPGSEGMVRAIMECVDQMFYDERLGLRLFTTPIANNEQAVRLVGRMGVLPSGTAENGEYHHGQIMMHVYRLLANAETDNVWEQFKPMLSVFRGKEICGPFDMPCTSYVADRDDPHYGKGMYFGLSGSTDWLIRFFEQIAGIDLNLHDSTLPDLTVQPKLPSGLGGNLRLSRIIHVRSCDGYKLVPLTVKVGRKKNEKCPRMYVNGEPCIEDCVPDVAKYERVEVEVFV